MSIQPINYQSPSFGHRITVRGSKGQVADFCNGILKLNEKARYVTSDGGKGAKRALVVTNTDLSRIAESLNGQEIAKADFDQIASATALDVKPFLKDLDKKNLDGETLSRIC